MTAPDPHDEVSRTFRQIDTRIIWFTQGVIAGFCITWTKMLRIVTRPATASSSTCRLVDRTPQRKAIRKP
jgi:hypothetical protein